jgi:putative tryptophan/tyrosine transport system substrate-binding protein
MIGRRTVIAGLGAAAGSSVIWPLAARGQQAERVRRIGVLMSNSEGDTQAVAGLAALTSALNGLGWTEGRNLHLEYRWGAGDVGRMQAFAKALVNLEPDLLMTNATPATAALQRETKTIPIVFASVSDPVGSGLVASLPHPGGNITGFVNIEGSVAGKWIDILKDIVPGVSAAALLHNPDTAPYFRYYLEPFEAAARSGGIEPIGAAVHTAEDIERVVANLGNRGGAGLVMSPDSFLQTKRNLDLVISLAARHRVPAIYPFRFIIAAGGLISYGVNNIDLYRRSASYVDRILKGAKPADLPVQLPTKFELAVNLKTARALGLNLSREFLLLADEVIE